MSMDETIRTKLTAAFSPEHLEVLNESSLHAGHHHTGRPHNERFPRDGETHYRVRIVAGAFTGMSRLERHRAVNAALADELASTVHALAVEARAPGEPGRRGT
ncbi:BolA family transcriptional regulator [Zhengella mangrovi]|uniref:BolA family transcriptional regulator n=1 Tax=Zhengella mangrovi TaxID=1982044 RepID=A0A2G1QJ62_9HYPH|nr:BolA family protein [Zhengella mangrovi]PHP65529.1 BolA family transcriptional regulator [Zhengella mangrovi]